MSRFYDRAGKAIDLREWAVLSAIEDYQRVAQEVLADKDVTVSTSWLGFNHGSPDGPPLIFETKVFGGDFRGQDERYSTEAEARAGHARWVELVRTGGAA